jgi:microcystin-dependent protein
MSVANTLGDAYYPLPIGVMMFWVGGARIGTTGGEGTGVPPEGWLICEGQTLNKADYPLLAEVVGQQYGIPLDPATQFILPATTGSNKTTADGRLPQYVAANDGLVSGGSSGDANLNFSITEANMPDLAFKGGGQDLGISVSNSVWTSTVNSARQVGVLDNSGASSNQSTTTASFLPNGAPVVGANITPSSTPQNISGAGAGDPVVDTIQLDAEVPARYEVPLIIKADYSAKVSA